MSCAFGWGGGYDSSTGREQHQGQQGLSSIVWWIEPQLTGSPGLPVCPMGYKQTGLSHDFTSAG
ncbi:MAG: hypothetical protein ACK55I_11940, partial [bacterium]